MDPEIAEILRRIVVASELLAKAVTDHSGRQEAWMAGRELARVRLMLEQREKTDPRKAPAAAAARG